MSSKPTPGPWCVPAGSGNEHVVCQGGDPHHPGRILFVLRHPMGTSNLIPDDEIAAAAQLAAEAGTVHHETGLTPQQLRERLNAAISVIHEVREFIDGQIDVVDGLYGEPAPNRAMVLARELDEVIASVEGEP